MPQRFHLLPHSCTDAQRLGRVFEKLFINLKVFEEAREDGDLAVPVAGCPYFSEFWVKGLVQLALNVGFVGGVPWSDSEVFGCDMMLLLLLLLWVEEVEEEEGEGEEEGDEETP